MKCSSKYSGGELLRRWFFLFLSIAVMTFGVSLSIVAGLGTSPISSLPYTLSFITPLTVGTATILLNTLFVLAQLVLLRREFGFVHLLQLPLSFVFGWMIDLFLLLMKNIVCETYLQQWICCMLGLLISGCGIAMQVKADVATLGGEGIVLALSKVTGTRFGTMKTIFDSASVLLSVLLALVFLGRIAGVREGTIMAALITGTLARWWGKILSSPSDRFFRGR